LTKSTDIIDFKEVAEEACIDEFVDYRIYEELSRSRIIRNESMKKKLIEMAEEEMRHYEFWKRYSEKCRVNKFRLRLKIFLVKILVLLMGITFTIKWLERHEKNVIETYIRVRKNISDKDLGEYDLMIKDEKEHEDFLINSLDEGRIKYLSFTVLGLSDALIEIAGIHAGTLGVYSDTIKAGLAGLVAGVAASIAMSSAAYAQSKQLSGSLRPGLAAMYTGIAYLLTAVLLALPYFLIHEIFLALAISLILSIGVLAYISLYSMILMERSFLRELTETTLIIFGATIVLYLFGEFVNRALGLHV